MKHLLAINGSYRPDGILDQAIDTAVSAAISAGAKIKATDGYNPRLAHHFHSVTAVFKHFMERLAVYAYWPWGAPAPIFRKSHMSKKAILIASCAAPGLMGTCFSAR